jgi:hypothetical protein
VVHRDSSEINILLSRYGSWTIDVPLSRGGSSIIDVSSTGISSFRTALSDGGGSFEALASLAIDSS